MPSGSPPIVPDGFIALAQVRAAAEEAEGMTAGDPVAVRAGRVLIGLELATLEAQRRVIGGE